MITLVLLGAVNLRICYDTINTDFCNYWTHLLICLCLLLHVVEMVVYTAVCLATYGPFVFESLWVSMFISRDYV
jgi:hypothetical protein